MKKFVFLTLFMCMMLSACAAPAPEGAIEATLEPAKTSAPVRSGDPELAPEPVSFERLPLVRREQTYGGGNALIYPAVDSEAYDSLNAAIFRKILVGLGAMEEPVYTYFSVKCNEDGILSLLVGYYDMDTRELYLQLPMTFDVATSKEIALEDCFDARSDRWRSILPDVVSAQAQSIGMTLLCDPLPVEDGQLYYLTSRSIVLLYRPYEITTYLSGWPEFSVSYDQMSACYDGEAAVMRLVSAEASGMVAEGSDIAAQEALEAAGDAP